MGSVEVNILGQRYRIKGDAPDEYIQELARFVDEKIREIYDKSPNTVPLRAAILSALDIADELYRYRREQEDLTKGIEKKTEQLVRLFD
ncbi:MAG TPA: cell division protein ZapA [Nitrospirae bacterium]|jgi:cell division protein ZapA|nr:cell division protein ZapA [Nitrospirota bacterium]